MTKVLLCEALAGQFVPLVLHDGAEEAHQNNAGVKAHVHVRGDLVVRRGELKISDGVLTMKDWHFSGLFKRTT